MCRCNRLFQDSHRLVKLRLLYDQWRGEREYIATRYLEAQTSAEAVVHDPLGRIVQAPRGGVDFYADRQADSTNLGDQRLVAGKGPQLLERLSTERAGIEQ